MARIGKVIGANQRDHGIPPSGLPQQPAMIRHIRDGGLDPRATVLRQGLDQIRANALPDRRRSDRRTRQATN